MRSSPAGSHKPGRNLQGNRSMCGCPGGNAAPASEQRLAMECCGPRTALFCPCRDGFPRRTCLWGSRRLFGLCGLVGVCPHKNQRAGSSKSLVIAWKPKPFWPAITPLTPLTPLIPMTPLTPITPTDPIKSIDFNDYIDANDRINPNDSH